MELWKIHKFCEGASLNELFERKLEIVSLMQKRNLSNTNAEQVLNVLEEYIELKQLFDQD